MSAKVDLIVALAMCQDEEKLKEVAYMLEVDKEFRVDKLGKWKTRGGYIVEIINLNNGNPLHPITVSYAGCDYFYTSEGKFELNSHADLVEFISAPEFTEEGLYEMANGEKVEIETSKIGAGIVLLKKVGVNQFWGMDGGYPMHPFSDSVWHTNKLIRYLGKKPFEIDKPGVYQNEEGRYVNFYTTTPYRNNLLLGFGFREKGVVGITQSLYTKNGISNLEDVAKIVKYMGVSYNFEKGEPA